MYENNIAIIELWIFSGRYHCKKSVPIRSYSGRYFPSFGLNTPYAVRMRENADQNNAKYRQFSPSVSLQIMGFYFELGKFLLKGITQGITKFTYDVTFTNDAYLQHLHMMPKPSKTL